MVEHRVGPVLDLVDRVIVLNPGGGVLADGAPDDVFDHHGAMLRMAGVWLPPSATHSPGDPPQTGRLAPIREAGPPTVQADAVRVVYPDADTAALDGVDLTACAGQILAVTGANGSGKSTLALVLASLLVPTDGSVRFLAGGPDRPYSRWRPRQLVQQVGTVFQEPEHQFVASTVAAELAVGPRRAGQDRATIMARTDELLERLALSGLACANPFTLSGGEKRRLSVATALATNPQLLVLDEPTFGQDARTWRELAELLAAQRDAGRAVVAVTHDDDLTAALADRQVTLSRGRVLASHGQSGRAVTTAP
jgi:energy-coupling factor transport system ATP-binding protein